MKKILVVLFLVVSTCTFANEQELNFEDSNVVTNIAYFGLKSEIQKLDKRAVGLWCLQKTEPKTYDKVKYDEFELPEAIEKAYNKLILKTQNSKNYLNKSGFIEINGWLGKYDFEKSGFPVKIDYEPYNGSYFGDNGSGTRAFVYFEPALQDIQLYLPMDKDQAKKFIAERKDGAGSINRVVKLKVMFKIKSIKSDMGIINMGRYSDIKANVNAELKNIGFFL